MNGTQPWNSMSGGAYSNLGHVPKDVNSGAPVTTTNSSGPSIGVSSLVTDANSSLSGGAQLQSSTSMNADSFMRVPASPMSFSSNNISGSSVVDNSIMQQSPPQEQVQKRRASSVTSQPVYEAGGSVHAQKKSRIDVRQNDILQHQMIQQLIHNQNSLHLHGQQNAQLQALIQQHKLPQAPRQLQHCSQPFSQIQRPQVGIPRQPQLRPPLSQPGMQLGGPVRVPVESGLCSLRRLMQYLYHKRHRPENNPITYWKKLVEEYFAPQARERWIHGAVTFAMCMEGKDMMLLEHAKVIQKSVYEHQHVTHEGHLRIIFTPELKIMSWEFCARRHEEYITRRILAPQVNNLLQVAQKYQSAVSGSGPAGVSNSDAQTICNMLVGLYVRCLQHTDLMTVNPCQISEVVNHMKDLIEFSNKNNIGPKESLNNYCKQTMSKLPVQNMHEARQVVAAAGLPNNQSNVNVMGTQQEISGHMNNGSPGVGAIGNNSPQNAAALSAYQNMLRSSSANQSLLQQETSRVFRGPGAMHNGMQMEVSRSFTHNQQHVFNQLLQEVRNNNNCTLGQQQPLGTSNVNSGLASGATVNNAATREQTQGISNSNGRVNGTAPVSTVPSNVINGKASTAPSRSNSFKSVSSNPAATGGNASTSKAESFNEMDDLSHLISSHLADSGLFMGEQGGGFSWDM
ncbi:hypothetical protein PR202_gb18127 [Eleusine coracana subsp. coracana]|uniref:Uncharacterized protein n=1 Tax=Eleusine coracana subsp. coracana TaxID=191504 RepID=A0AAV5F6J3_ELECO|nr:hypothetical protein PR202_gb18127 [Eleusine coracana subsp. coracana]